MPPNAGVAVKLTLLPAQMVEPFDKILTVGVEDGFTVILILLLVALVVVTQGSLLTIVQVITSLFCNELLE